MTDSWTFETVSVGDSHEIAHTITAEDVDAFSRLSGDTNPIHLDAAYARDLGYKDRVVYGALSSAYVSRLIGNHFPGPGTIWLSQQLRFESPLYIGDSIIVRVTVRRKNAALRTMALAVEILKQPAHQVASGEVTIGSPENLLAVKDSGPAIAGEALVSVAARDPGVRTQDAVAIVTGASRGIGAAVAESLAGRGIRVIINYRSDREGAESAVRRIKDNGGQAVSVRADVTVPEEIAVMYRTAIEQFGRVDIVVNNAGPRIIRKGVDDLTLDDLKTSFDHYAGAAFELVRLAAPGMRERGFGRIINVLTTAINGPPPTGWGAYVAGKAALAALSRSFAVELGPSGVTCNMVSPSVVHTDLWSNLSENQLRAMALRNPMKRLTQAKDVAETVVFLASPEAQHLNGVNITVSGGETMI